ncbi:MAG: hypothetical protein RH949_10440 [Coleofasciculus sp. A1-SPW-01]|uniref:hypothetical protein n=1 Tax=Coleofasciculus sp. A1-SPW-01 TaxID=3070819 RepID=UPI0032FD300A
MLIFQFVKKVIYNCLRYPDATASAIYRNFFQLFGGLTIFVIRHLLAPLAPRRAMARLYIAPPAPPSPPSPPSPLHLYSCRFSALS